MGLVVIKAAMRFQNLQMTLVQFDSFVILLVNKSFRPHVQQSSGLLTTEPIFVVSTDECEAYDSAIIALDNVFIKTLMNCLRGTCLLRPGPSMDEYLQEFVG